MKIRTAAALTALVPASPGVALVQGATATRDGKTVAVVVDPVGTSRSCRRASEPWERGRLARIKAKLCFLLT